MLLKAIVAALCLATAPTLNIPGATPPPPSAATQPEGDVGREGIDYPTEVQKSIVIATVTNVGPAFLADFLPLKDGLIYQLASANFSQASRGGICIATFNITKGKAGAIVGAAAVNLIFVFDSGHWKPVRDVFKAL